MNRDSLDILHGNEYMLKYEQKSILNIFYIYFFYEATRREILRYYFMEEREVRSRNSHVK